jgi:hypothetical protein
MPYRILLVASLLAAALPGAGRAQTAEPPSDSAAPQVAYVDVRYDVLRQGARVHVRQRAWPREVTGRIVAADGSGITVVPGNGDPRVTLPYDAIERLEVSTGVRSPGSAVGRGMGRGVAFGAAAVLGAVLVTGFTEKDCEGCIWAAGMLVYRAPLLLAGTAVAGGLYGSAHPGEGWRTVNFPVRLVPSDAACTPSPAPAFPSCIDPHPATSHADASVSRRHRIPVRFGVRFGSFGAR